jgi:hypothetical protein
VWRPNTPHPWKPGLVRLPPEPTDPALMEARAKGRTMSLNEAVTYALEPVRGMLADRGVSGFV